ncbi:MAG: DUF2752 domain-containing protein [Luteibaculum sp.]
MLIAYLKINWYYGVAVSYFALALLLEAYTNISITPPCISVLLLDAQCPGCGLSRAFAHMLHFEFLQAWNSNFLAFGIIPMVLIAFVFDSRRFKRVWINKKEVG